MIRKIQITFLMLFSMCIIIVGGYNCAQKIDYSVGDTGVSTVPVDTSVSYEIEDSEEDTESLLPDKPLDNRCNRSQYNDLEETYGSSAFIVIDGYEDSWSDYRFGIENNFDLNCVRFYMKMSRNKKKHEYKGTLTISYEDGNVIKMQKYTTPFSKFNTWEDRDRTASSTGRLDSEFYAIFENPHGSLIFHVSKLLEKNLRDGKNKLIGSGKIWFKMFRVYANDRDTCYRSGAYVSKAIRVPPRPRQRCWLLNAGPYSCKPQGAFSAFTSLEQDDYDCYDVLGRFGNLDIREAFGIRKGFPY